MLPVKAAQFGCVKSMGFRILFGLLQHQLLRVAQNYLQIKTIVLICIGEDKYIAKG